MWLQLHLQCRLLLLVVMLLLQGCCGGSVGCNG
jgi:hypothetical protein